VGNIIIICILIHFSFCALIPCCLHADQIAALSWENKPWYPLSRRLGGAQRQSGYFGEEKNLLPLLENKPWIRP